MTSRKWFSQTPEPVAALNSAHLEDAAHAVNLYSLDMHLGLDFIPIKRQSIRMEGAKAWFSLSLARGSFSSKFPTVAGTGCLRTISILPVKLLFLAQSSICHGHVGCSKWRFLDSPGQQQVSPSVFLTGRGL